MEKSCIFELIEREVIQKWRKEIREREKDSIIFRQEQEAMERLEAGLGSEARGLARSYQIALEDKLDYEYIKLMTQLTHYSIKLGMNLETH